MRITWVIDPSDTNAVPVVGTTTPTQGQGKAYPSGLTTNGCGTLYFINKSNVVVYIVFEDGSVTELPAWWARPYAPKTRTNQLWLTQGAMLNTQAGNPISQLTLESYQPGEDATGLYSGPINYQTNIGGGALSQATSVVQTGSPALTPVVSATPNANFNPAPSLLETIINNDGTFLLGQNGTLGTNAGLAILSQAPGIFFAAQFNATAGPSVPAVTFLGKSPVQLQTGNQETGHCGGGNSNGAAGGTNYWTTNYKTVMTNQPTSMTFTAESTLNTGAPFLSSVSDIYGFTLGQVGIAAGPTTWIGTYLTVGN